MLDSNLPVYVIKGYQFVGVLCQCFGDGTFGLELFSFSGPGWEWC